ncbi:MAG: NADH-quinone oxidoreductase subunit J [Acidobacteriaceae bacterium]|nr:NADH-quinone oxidoreductase subunit J [Acidobacteriaceae bacterium]MBV9763774.1 NADH-quinone oxidoreductase subunit J [Acidobacteriaceae bacterium]
MLIVFYIAAAVAVLATTVAITRNNAVHALLYMIVSLLAVAVIFYVIGAPFIAALELIIYAGAIMVLFLFVVMMLNIGEHATDVETAWLKPGVWAWPSGLATLLLLELFYVAAHAAPPTGPMHAVTPKEIGISLFGPYAIGVELASLLLMAGLVGAYHLGRRTSKEEEERNDASTYGRRTVFGSDVVRTGSDRTSHAA